MTIRHIRIFVEVCKTMNATRAASCLHMSQPAISLAIKELETYYGVQLFDRIGKRLYLTGAGDHMLSYAANILTLFDDMEKGIRNRDMNGRLRIGSSITIGTRLMPGFMKTFTAQWPQVQVKVVIDSSDVIIRKVQDNALDLALIEGATNAPFLTVEPFMSDELTVVCAPHHPLAVSDQISADALYQEKILLREPGSGTRDLFDHAMAAAGLLIEPSWESTSTTALINAAAENLGLAVIPLRLAQDALAQDRVATLIITGISLQRKFNIIYHKNKLLTKSALAFLDVCQSSGDSRKGQLNE